MNRSGIPTLNAGAYDNLPGSSLRLSGDQRPTYTQRRRTQMAGGGIMGSNAGSMLVAPTADGSRPGYGWLEDAWETAKKVGQTLIPGGDPGYFDLYPDKSPPDQPDYGPYSTSPIYTPPTFPEGQPDYGPYSTSPTHIPEGQPDYGPYSTSPIYTPPTFPEGQPDYGPYSTTPTHIPEEDLPWYKDLYNWGKEQLGDILNPQQPTYNPNTGKMEYPINWKGPLTMGTSIGLADYLSRDKTPFPADQTSINFQTAEEAMADSKQRFKPPRELTQLAAEGGRIGASNGGIQGLMPRRGRVIYPGGYNGDTDFQSWAKRNHIDLNALNATDFQNAIDRWNDERPQHLPQKAQGGRIGYQGNGAQDVDPMAEIVALMSKRMTEGLTQDETDRLDKLIQATGFMEQKAQGGRIGAQEGGLMDMGGMEKDYRQEGGFVPIGGQEKADDVPARLSKNEFVFTADAVRAAGGGDIDAGAEIMENVMDNLEAGGKVSEESQGLEGAQEMFANAQELEKRII